MNQAQFISDWNKITKLQFQADTKRYAALSQ